LEDVFRTLIKKKYGTDENFDVIVNTNTGDLEIWRVREVVPDGEVTNERSGERHRSPVPLMKA
jgi:N utilization substance protein A